MGRDGSMARFQATLRKWAYDPVLEMQRRAARYCFLLRPLLGREPCWMLYLPWKVRTSAVDGEFLNSHSHDCVSRMLSLRMPPA